MFDLLVIVAGSVVAAVARVQPEATPTVPVEASAPAPAATWAWKVGTQKLTIEQDVEVKSTATAMLALTQKQLVELAFTVKAVDAQGTALVEIELRRVRVAVGGADLGKAEVDSAAAPINEEFDPNQAVRNLVGAKLTATLSNTGIASNVSGITELRDRAKRLFGGQRPFTDLADRLISDVTAERVAATLTGIFAEQSTVAPMVFDGVGTLTPTVSTASMWDGAKRTTHRTIAYTLATPNNDPVTRAFDVAVTDAEQTVEVTTEPAAGLLRSSTSELTLTTAYTQRGGGVEDKRSLTQRVTVKAETVTAP